MNQFALGIMLCLTVSTAAQAQSWISRSPSSAVVDLAVDPSNDSHWIAQTAQYPPEFQETMDAGLSWQALALPSDAIQPASITFSPSGSTYLTIGRSAAPLAGEPYAFIRGSSGWNPFGPTTTAPIKHWASHLRIGSANPDLMAFIMVEDGSFEYGLNTNLYLSDDAGLTWSAPAPWRGEPLSLDILESNSEASIVRCDGFDPSTGTEVYCFISDGWRSPRIRLNQTYSALQATLSVSKHNPDNMLYSTFNVQEFAWAALPMQRSNDGGVTWSDVGVPGHYSSLVQGELDLDLALRHAGRSVQDGLQLSRDNGSTWTTLTSPPGAANQRFKVLLKDHDSKLFAFGSFGLYETELLLPIGSSECSAQVNGTGQPALISAHGTTSIAANDLTLFAQDVTPAQFGIFIASQNPGFTSNPGSSFGDLCLSGSIGRFNTQILNSGPFGEFLLNVDLQAIPTPNQPATVQAGQTWRFQAWYRDNIGGQQSSNFSDAVAVLFAP